MNPDWQFLWQFSLIRFNLIRPPVSLPPYKDVSYIIAQDTQPTLSCVLAFLLDFTFLHGRQQWLLWDCALFLPFSCFFSMICLYMFYRYWYWNCSETDDQHMTFNAYSCWNAMKVTWTKQMTHCIFRAVLLTRGCVDTPTLLLKSKARCSVMHSSCSGGHCVPGVTVLHLKLNLRFHILLSKNMLTLHLLDWTRGNMCKIKVNKSDAKYIKFESTHL